VIRFSFALLLSLGCVANAQDFKALEQKVSDFTLSNGLRLLVVERHDAPLVSFVTHAAAGSVNDSTGATGLAHFFERLAFKGTDSIGTRDAAAEKKALDAMEEAFNRLDAERAKGRLANEVAVVRLELEAQRATALANSFVVPNALHDVYDENAASGLRSSVTADSAQFHVVLPSNRAELWFLLEAQRLARPVFRDFYRERDAAAVDYRNRLQTNSQARLLQALAAAAFSAHPYRNPPFGWPADFSHLRQSDARQFFNRYYAPANLTIAIAGDIRPEEARRLAEKHLAPIPARPMPPPPRTEEPPQQGPRTVILENSADALVALGFKRPDEFDRDDAVLDVVQFVLTGSRSSVLWKDLVTSRLATNVVALPTWPGGRSPHLFTIILAAAPGHTAEEAQNAALVSLARLQAEPVDEPTLSRAKTHARTALVRRLADNSAIASTLALYAADYGDWRKIFAAADAFSKVTAAQVQVAAAKYFIPSRRTSVLMVPPAPVRPEAPKGAAR
jgi:predicted Zn-dependent peptidase